MFRVISLLLLLFLFVAFAARAGDEVDYSAPYLTVENGELVTRYPAREHAVDADVPQPVGQRPDGDDTPRHRRWWLGAGVTLLLAGAAVYLRRRGRPA